MLLEGMHSRVYPPVHRLTTRGQWLGFAGVMLTLAVLSAFPGARDFQRRGFDVHWWQFLTGGVLGVGVFLVLARPVWRALDAFPFAPGRRWRGALARMGVALAYTVVGGFTMRLILMATIAMFGMDWRVLGDPNSGLASFMLQSLYGFMVLLLAHTVLQRTFERQQLLLLEQSFAQARLQALALELQPHFLFNALNGIAALVRDDPPRAERMLVRLSDLLRATLTLGTNGEIALHQELANLDLYLDLQMMRFGPRLDVVRAIDSETLGARVPPMLLQPLVENALTHGLGRQTGPGRLELFAQRRDDMLILRVADNGVGLPAERHHERTGLGTTRARLGAMFGVNHSMTLVPGPSGGAVAEVRIPFRVSEQAS